MKLKLLFIGVLLLVSALLPAPVSRLSPLAPGIASADDCTPVPSGLISWWRAEGNAFDAMGANNGSPVGNTTYAAGMVGQAFSFDGAGDYVDLGTGLNPGNDMTVDAWIKPTAVSSFVAIVSKWDQDFSASGNPADGYLLVADSAQLHGYVHQQGTTDEPNAIGGTLAANQWRHVAMTYENSTGTVTIYVNGVSVGSNSGPDGPGVYSSSASVAIGAEKDGAIPQRFFNGLIDEVEIFNRELSASEIDAIHDAGADGKCHLPLVVNSTLDTADHTPGNGFCSVGAATGGVCTLRAAIQEANADLGADTINFNISGCPGGICTITSSLPTVDELVTIDATTQPGWAAGAPVIELTSPSVGSGVGLWLNAPATVKGLVINRFGNGILLGDTPDAGGSVITGNFIGTNVAGTADLGNAAAGISLQTDGATPVTIGGNGAALRNVISGNDTHGIEISGDAGGHNIWGNYIGTNKTGTAALGNGESGIRIIGRSDINIGGTTGVTVGGPCTGYCNLISGNGTNGIQLDGATGLNESHAHMVKGNYIGTDVTGTIDLGNTENGVFIKTIVANGVSVDHIIGGTSASERNLISGNNASGIVIQHPTIGVGTLTGNLVQGNYIGTDVSGTLDRGNTGNGVVIYAAAGSTIGGTAAGARNVISGNDNNGVLIEASGATGNTIQGNYIGTNADGDDDLANTFNGIRIEQASNIIGGSAAGAGNLISGNGTNGIQIINGFAQTNTVKGNLIGTDAAGTADLGNTSNGINLNAAPNNTVGGIAAGEGNTIAFNDEAGVLVNGGVTTTGNSIRGNSIFENTGLGIDNVIPAANSIAPPTITATGSASGTVNCAGCTIDVYSDDDNEGKTYEGTATSGTGGSGPWAWSFSGSVTGPHVTATVTDGGNNTSEFSVPAVTVPFVVNSTADTSDADPGNGFCSITTPTGGACTLRAALEEANASPGANTIEFDFPGVVLYTISPATDLPTIIEPVVIDGFTQTGASANTNAFASGLNAVWMVRIDGLGASGATAGLQIDAGGSGSTIRGIQFVNFSGAGADSILIGGGTAGSTIEGNSISIASGAGNAIRIDASDNNLIGGTTNASRNHISGNILSFGVVIEDGSEGNDVQGNYIGTNNAGTAAAGFARGVRIINSGINDIGGVNAGERNLISGNGSGVYIEGIPSSGNVVQGNLIGTKADGTGTVGGITLSGVRITTGANTNTIGSFNPEADNSGANVIANNLDAGVLIEGTGGGVDGNTVRGNSIFNNTPGINLTDSANDGILPPEIDSVGSASGTVDCEECLVDVYSDDASEGRIYEGTATSADGPCPCFWFFGDPVTGPYVTATVTNANGSTSEFSEALGLSATFLVNSIDDDADADIGDGVCETTTSGECTLRAAIEEANANPSSDEIDFDIDGGCATVCTITPASDLPAITEAVRIDGFSQPDSVINSTGPGAAMNAVWKIVLSGSGYTGETAGLQLAAGSEGSAIQGLSITGWTGPAIWMNGSSDSEVVGNSITNISTGAGVKLTNAVNNSIGNTADSQRNLISGNPSSFGVLIEAGSTGNQVQNNYIGLAADGVTGSGNGTGIRIIDSPGNGVGGTLSGTGNFIVANGAGVQLTGAASTGNYVQGNVIGSDGLGNATTGVAITLDASDNFIGAEDPFNFNGGANSISFNAGAGVAINGDAAGNQVRGNSIHDNTGDAIDLQAGGNEGILPPSITDADATTVDGEVDCETCAVDVYEDSGTESETYLGTATSDSGPCPCAWTFSGFVTGPNVTATVTEAGNTSELSAAFPVDADTDGDGVPDATDNCPNNPNPAQPDLDGDNLGNACDPDLDGDGIDNGPDNCDRAANPSQADMDGDLKGDKCDIDIDGDGFNNGPDNCDRAANPSQTDTDGDNKGDACDIDLDGDGFKNGVDNCKFVANPGQENNDGNGGGDACDPDDDNDGNPDTSDTCDFDPDPCEPGPAPVPPLGRLIDLGRRPVGLA